MKESLTALIARDKALEQEANSIASVDRLVRYHRDLFTLLNNFVSFQDFYSPGTQAIFQSGSLYIDGRSSDLCIKVDDIAKHSAMASLSQTYMAYCECRRNGNAEKMNIAAATAEAGKPPAAAPFDVGKFAGIFAAIGLAIGAIGTAMASVLTGLLNLSWWQMPLAIAGLMLLISGPSIVMTYFKLRKRNLAPILDANGWAVNTRAIVNIPFGKTLTALARLPEGAQSSLLDPFAEKERLHLLLLHRRGGGRDDHD